PDANDVATAQQLSRLVQRSVEAQLDVAVGQQRLTRTVFAVDVAITKTAAVTQEVLVHRAVVAVFDTADFAITLARADVATAGTAVADARRKLHVPFTVVTLGVSLVGEHT